MVRSYVPPNGVAVPSRRTLDPFTILQVANPAEPLPTLPRHQYLVMRECQKGRLSIAEVSAHLGLSGTTVKVLVAELVNAKLLISLEPRPQAGAQLSLLEKVLNGLQSL